MLISFHECHVLPFGSYPLIYPSVIRDIRCGLILFSVYIYIYAKWLGLQDSTLTESKGH